MNWNITGLCVAYIIFNFNFQLGQEYAYREAMMAFQESGSERAFRVRIEKRRDELFPPELIRYLNDQMHHPPHK